MRSPWAALMGPARRKLPPTNMKRSRTGETRTKLSQAPRPPSGCGPAEGYAQRRQRDGPDEVAVRDGVQSEPPHPRRRIVPELPGAPSVGPLVHGEREDHGHEEHEALNERAAGQQLSLTIAE